MYFSFNVIDNLDIRLVPETDSVEQVAKIKKHIEEQGYYVIDRDPTNEERHKYSNIVKFKSANGVNSFRTDPDSDFGKKVREDIANGFGYDPVVIRIMGGTVPIVPLINPLDLPTVIVPMVNIDNNQHSPNENIRIGNIGKVFIFHYLFYVLTINGLKQNNYLQLTNAVI